MSLYILLWEPKWQLYFEVEIQGTIMTNDGEFATIKHEDGSIKRYESSHVFLEKFVAQAAASALNS